MASLRTSTKMSLNRIGGVTGISTNLLLPIGRPISAHALEIQPSGSWGLGINRQIRSWTSTGDFYKRPGDILQIE